MSRSSIARVLSAYYCWSYLIVVLLGTYYATAQVEVPLAAQVFSWGVLLSYAALYLLPALLLTWIVRLLCTVCNNHQNLPFAPRAVLWCTAVLATSCTGFVLLVDRSVYELFGFHLNGFVWNLVTTPGGLESLESSERAEWKALLRFAGLVALHSLILYLCLRRERTCRESILRKPGRKLAGACLVILIAQAVVYAFSQLYGYTPVAVAAARFPGYLPLTIGRLAKKWGFGPQREIGIELTGVPLTLHYPLRPLADPRPVPPRNMVWIVIESLRADMLDPEVMPHTHALAQRSLHCTTHYAGGNGTRMGTFALFYGLYSTYWFPFLDERRPPVLMEALERRGYRIEAWSSASFTYPEFDKTIFAGLPIERLHPYRRELSKPDNDRALVREFDAALDVQATDQPFSAFLFFDSTHARYHFAEESILRQPYAEDIDYTAMDLEHGIEGIRNRYINAVHDVDGRVGEVLALLERRGLTQNTIVLVTGDHGQEFMEKGRWGHNSSFSEEQLRVPLVLHVPGCEARRLTRLTSHLDVPATILPLLGFDQASSDYSLGYDLFGEVERSFTVVANWTELCWVDNEVKITLPYRGPAVLGEDIRARNDSPLRDTSGVLQARASALASLLRDMARFGQAGAGAP